MRFLNHIVRTANLRVRTVIGTISSGNEANLPFGRARAITRRVEWMMRPVSCASGCKHLLISSDSAMPARGEHSRRVETTPEVEYSASWRRLIAHTPQFQRRVAECHRETPLGSMALHRTLKQGLSTSSVIVPQNKAASASKNERSRRF